MTDVQTVIEQAVRAALDPISVDAIEIEQRPDNSDKDALYVTVILPPETPRVGGKKYLAAMVSVSDALLVTGEQRFPYVSLRYLGEDAPEESDRYPAIPQ